MAVLWHIIVCTEDTDWLVVIRNDTALNKWIVWHTSAASKSKWGHWEREKGRQVEEHTPFAALRLGQTTCSEESSSATHLQSFITHFWATLPKLLLPCVLWPNDNLNWRRNETRTTSVPHAISQQHLNVCPILARAIIFKLHQRSTSAYCWEGKITRTATIWGKERRKSNLINLAECYFGDRV